MRTICALATARMNCAIHLIRVSGSNAYQIVQKICQKPIKKVGYVIQRNKIIDGEHIIDDVLLNTFVAPKSYTGEDLIEINCHGGVIVAEKILQLLTRAGCFPAQRGEYTERALLNQKLDWSQVEAVNNLVNARNEYSIYGSIGALTGKLSQVIDELQQKLFRILGQIEVNIDYPEFDDVPEITIPEISDLLLEIISDINHLVQKSQRFLPVAQGINVAIIGEPNVGKSSLLNFLTNEDKAIVSATPGTTRDVVESWINFSSLTLHLLDTAGIRQTDDAIEQSGIQKSFATIQKADLIIWLKQFGSSATIPLQLTAQQHLVEVFSKADLIPIEEQNNGVFISVKNGNIQPLLTKIQQIFLEQDFTDANLIVLQSQRQIDLLQSIANQMENVLAEINQGTYIDLIAEQLEKCNRMLNDLLGRGENYDFLDQLFQNFCIGK